MKRLFGLGAMPIIVFLFSINVYAAELNAEITVTGVIDTVDLQARTLVVVNDETGAKERFRFDNNTRIVFKDKESTRGLLKPGLTVILKLPANNEALATAN